MKRPTLKSLTRSAVLLAGLTVAAAEAQPTITDVYPNGANLFQPSETLSFLASSTLGVTNVTVQLTTTSLTTGQSFIRNLNSANGLTITGPSTGYSVSASLASNTLYSAVIHVTDADGISADSTVSFNTINPSYTWEAEDWDYTSNGVSGLFIDNPQTNGYAGLLTTDNVDAHNGNGPSPYRIGGDAGGGGLATETVQNPEADHLRVQYVGTGNTNKDYDIGYTDGGDFGNYTRHFPAGTYNIFVRASGGNGPRDSAATMSVVSGTATLSGVDSGTGPFRFAIQGRGWQTYDFCPVKDNAGNLAQLTIPEDGSPSTLQMLIDQANCNINFFMLIPVNTNIPVSTATITNIFPNGAALFQSSDTLSFNIVSTNGVATSDISVQVTATNLYGNGSIATLTSGNGLEVSGFSTNLTVTAPLTSNTVYSVFIQVYDAFGVPTSSTVTFDTIVPAYSFEAEDFNYGGGSFIDNPQTNAYFGLDAVENIDFHATQHGGDYNRVGLTTEGLNEKQRPQYDNTGFQDYDVGFNDTSGAWGNYTRTFPAGNYNIYVRASNGNGNSGLPNSGSISLVTGDTHGTDQSTVTLGNFTVPPTGSWGTYAWIPVKDAAGNLAQFTGGSEQTLRVTVNGGNYNANFYLLTPVDASAVLQPYVDTFKPDGTALFQPSNTLSFIVHSQPGVSDSNVKLNLNGVDVSGLTFSGTPNIRTASYALKPNAYYTAIVTVTDANGTVRTTNSFGAFESTNYQWEAEDYDYDSGKFFDDQINAYAGLGSVPDVDNHQANINGNPFLYRLNSPAPSTGNGDLGGELPRPQFTSGGGSGTDYNIGFFGFNSWLNYTRHYPAGTYNVIGRFAEGQQTTQAALYQVVSGFGTTAQVTNQLGTFIIPPVGWSSWEWVPLTDASGKQVKVTLDGSQATLRLGGTPVEGLPEVNVNFLMLVPTIPDVLLTGKVSGLNLMLSFGTQNGTNYQVQYKNNLTDPDWLPLGGVISGNGGIQSVSDPITGTNRFYRVQVQ